MDVDMLTGFVAPTADLDPFIERVWWCQSPRGEHLPMPLLSPGVGAELYLHLGRPFSVNGVQAPSTHLLSARTAAIDFGPQDNLAFIAVRFRAGALRHFIPLPITEVPEGLLDATLMWASMVSDLRDRIGDLRSLCAQAESVLDWCRDQYQSRQKPDRSMDHALRTLYDAPGSADMDAVARSAGLGLRQFQRRFKAITGIGPKRFQRLTRLYKLVRSSALSPSARYLGDALDLGFYDQPHVIHEFQDLTGAAPRAFLREVARRTHFYNPPRPRAF
jgi:AraC-like DNA-binding protein